MLSINRKKPGKNLVDSLKNHMNDVVGGVAVLSTLLNAYQYFLLVRQDKDLRILGQNIATYEQLVHPAETLHTTIERLLKDGTLPFFSENYHMPNLSLEGTIDDVDKERGILSIHGNRDVLMRLPVHWYGEDREAISALKEGDHVRIIGRPDHHYVRTPENTRTMELYFTGSSFKIIDSLSAGNR